MHANKIRVLIKNSNEPLTTLHKSNLHCVKRKFVVDSIGEHYVNNNKIIAVKYVLEKPVFLVMTYFSDMLPRILVLNWYSEKWAFLLQNLHKNMLVNTRVHFISLHLWTFCSLRRNNLWQSIPQWVINSPKKINLNNISHNVYPFILMF